MRQLSLFEKERTTLEDSLELTARSLNEYGHRYNYWSISFSGGKDSTALVTSVIHLIETGRVKAPSSLTVIYADTRMELPPLQAGAMQLLREVEKRGFNTQIVTAEIDKRFLVYILGRGVPPPNNSTLRWCTQQIKLTPMATALQSLRERVDEKILMLTGVRIGESAVRDARIAVSCSKNGSECGQGWFQRDLPDALGDKLSPILHWRVCHIWDWLFFEAPSLGFNTELVAEAYGGDEAEELNARTGCICCPLASKDLALDNLIKNPKWSYLGPLKELRPLYEDLRSFENRLQKHGERNKDGNYSANPNRKGPLTLKARVEALEKILSVQNRVNREAFKFGQPIDILNREEEARIRELIELKTFPNKWTGDEPNGSELLPTIYPDGSIQPLLWQ